VVRWAARALLKFFKSRASLVAENLCLRQQLLVLQRRHPRPRLKDADRRFWILTCRWFSDWRRSLLIVKPGTVLGWHRKGWKSYWHWRSRASGNNGRHPISGELKLLIRRMTSENTLWGQRRIQAELARLGYKVSARTVAKYMRRPHGREPSPGWRIFLKQHAGEIWACDFISVQTVLFRTLYVFFVVRHASRQVLHIQVTEHPTAMWAAQQIVECCGWDHKPPRFLIHDRDSRYGERFDRRLQGLCITQIRTPFRAPRTNSIAERWVRSARHEYLDHIFIFGERHLRRVLAEYVAYFNQWRPHRSIGQRAPCAPPLTTLGRQSGTVMATPVLGGLHHIYQIAV
jgi:transposase InsO family protein